MTSTVDTLDDRSKKSVAGIILVSNIVLYQHYGLRNRAFVSQADSAVQVWSCDSWLINIDSLPFASFRIFVFLFSYSDIIG